MSNQPDRQVIDLRPAEPAYPFSLHLPLRAPLKSQAVKVPVQVIRVIDDYGILGGYAAQLLKIVCV
jgi:hypothetical protein